MKPNRWARIGAGALCAIAASWLALGLFFELTLALLLDDTPQRVLPFDFGWLEMPLFIVAGVLILAVSFTILAGAAGLICAFFWHPFATVSDYERWGFCVWLLATAPAALFFGLGFVTFLPSLVPFYKALDFGVKWWPNRGWRHLFGATNQWERDHEE